MPATADKSNFIESWPKRCGCGCSISEAEWDQLRYVGVQKVPREYGMPDLELRNCGGCGSTLAITLPVVQ